VPSWDANPRASGEFLEAAAVAGLASAGVDVIRVGVIPTPAIAYLTIERGADLGVVLSASHNPMPDNGIKFFDAGGFKLDDSVEDAIEARLDAAWTRPTGADVGRVTDHPAGVDDYVAHLVSSVGQRLDGLRVVVDCANGAAFGTAPAALHAMGADVTAIHAEPDGLNINDNCGSTHLSSLQEAVLAQQADIGIAHDGDADRFLAVDATGTVRRRRPVAGDPRARPPRRRHAARRHRRGHRHEQPRLHPGHAARGHRGRADRGRRPVRARVDARRGLHPRRRAVRPRHPGGAFDHW